MIDKIKKHYDKILNLFKEHKSDTERYKEEIEKLLELTKDNEEFKEYYFEAKFRLAKYYQRKNKYDLSEKLFLELINDKDVGNLKLKAIEQLAYDFRILKKYDEAIFWYEKLLEESKSDFANFKYYEKIVLAGLAKCRAITNGFEEERKNYYVLLADCLKAEDFKKLSQDIINLQNKLLNVTNFEEKTQISDEINDLESFLNSSYEQRIDINMRIAKSYFNEKKYGKCRDEIQKIFEILKYSVSDLQDYATTNGNMLLAKTYFEENDFEKAREYFEPIVNTPKDYKYYKYMISDIHTARKFLEKMKKCVS